MPRPAGPSHLHCALLPQPTRGAFDLDWLHGKNVHGCFQLPPHPGVRHDEPGQGLCHRTFEFLWAEEYLHPLNVRIAPPTCHRQNLLGVCLPRAQHPQTRAESQTRTQDGQEEGRAASKPAVSASCFSSPVVGRILGMGGGWKLAREPQLSGDNDTVLKAIPVLGNTVTRP